MVLLKKVLFAVVGVLVLLALVGFLLPGDYKVSRTISINAPAQQVYAQVVDLKAWKHWGVWFEREPDMPVTYSGPQSAVGMKSAWQSGTQGSGEMTLVDLKPFSEITYSLYMPEMEMGSTGKMTFVEQNGQTSVTWSDEGELGNNPMVRYFGLMLDGMIGPDFEAGLHNLKELVEKRR